MTLHRHSSAILRYFRDALILFLFPVIWVNGSMLNGICSRFLVSWSISVLALASCSASKPDYQQTGELFLETYYLKANPSKALDLTLEPASEKLRHELDLLKGVPASHASEQPRMSYKIFSCDLVEAKTATCRYQLDIQMDRKRIRKGLLTLRSWENGWRVTQFVEEPYES